MKTTQVNKLILKSHADLGEENIHVKTDVTLPLAMTDEAEAIVAKIKALHTEIEEMGQTALNLDGDPDFEVITESEER